jgi:signal transduction histidine kinase
VNRNWSVLARLDASILADGLRSEFLTDRPSAFQGIEFSLVNEAGEEILATDPQPGREVGLEKPLKGDFPNWRLVIYKKRESELAELGRQRALRQYAILALGLLALLSGALAVLAGLGKERRMVRMKTNFLSAVSHELKTPLTSIRMFSEMLASGRPIPEAKRKNYAELIGREALRLHGMIEGILSTTRLEEKDGGLRFAPLALTDVVQEVAQIMEDSFAKAKVRLHFRTEGDTTLLGDADALRSVVQNLLENSLKYSGPGTHVTAEATPTNDGILLRVSDQGIGISAADLKHVFDRFYRAGDEMTRKARGSGLGLSLVKQICDAHGASIDVKSKVGEGTQISVVFTRKGGKHASHLGS